MTQKEICNMLRGTRARRVSQYLNAAIVPLFVIFVATVVMSLATIQ